MKKFKSILLFLGYLIIKPTNKYLINEVIYSDLNYSKYHLFRIYKIFYSIPITIHITTIGSLGSGKEKALMWYYKYGDNCKWVTYYSGL